MYMYMYMYIYIYIYIYIYNILAGLPRRCPGLYNVTQNF